MYLLIITMPLIGSIISGFFGRKVGIKGSQFMTCTLILLTATFVIISFIEVGFTGIPVSIYLLRWIDLEYLNIYLSFNFDSLTTLMLIPVLFVSCAVHIYSIGYMSNDPHNQRFFSYLSLFTFMMIILVTANNYLLMFVGWEGVGICSYLLVSFWFTRIAANQSSISAILTNRVGDCFLTIGMFAILWSVGNLDYVTVFSIAPFINENIILIIGVCLLIGAMAKSSQIGLHVWLPMAMEGPTPVSALIHAATMVTAGVYLLIRSSPLIEYSATVLLLCLWVGAITSLFSSLIGLFQQDIKKVIAYSTMSQLGLMVVAIGLSSYTLALFHLINHAFYKALLFLGAGAVIHAVSDKQDFRKYGGLKEFLPLSYSVMLIASLSLVAFPFMTGFFSKDFILESSYGKFNLSSIVVYYITTIGAMFTTLYSVKTLYLTFIANPNGAVIDHKNTHEGNIYMSLPLVVLAIFSIFFGFLTKDMFIGLGSDLFTDNSIFIHPINENIINTEFAVSIFFKLLPFIFTISLIVLSLFISEYSLKYLMMFKFSTLGYNVFSFLNLRFSVELIYNKYITGTILNLGGNTIKILDKGAIELIGPYGLQNSLINISHNLSRLDTGVVTSYALYILMAALTYMYLPEILSSSICIVLILFLSIILFKKPKAKKIILEEQSKIISKLFLKKFIRMTIIAIILFILRSIIITIFNLDRTLFQDFVIMTIIVNFIHTIVEVLCLPREISYTGGPNEPGGENYKPSNNRTPTTASCNFVPTPNNSSFASTSNNSLPSTNNSISNTGNNTLPGIRDIGINYDLPHTRDDNLSPENWGAKNGRFIRDIYQWPNRHLQVASLDKDNLERYLGKEYIDDRSKKVTNDVIKHHTDGVIGMLSTVESTTGDPSRFVLRQGIVPRGNLPEPNASSISKKYWALHEQANALAEENQAGSDHYRYLSYVYKTKVWESWGVYNSTDHHMANYFKGNYNYERYGRIVKEDREVELHKLESKRLYHN